jgi:hypothetical protein
VRMRCSCRVLQRRRSGSAEVERDRRNSESEVIERIERH